ncbi:MAG: hypothetical protein WBA57_08700 [Elainellaceae cyanobacterium]
MNQPQHEQIHAIFPSSDRAIDIAQYITSLVNKEGGACLCLVTDQARWRLLLNVPPQLAEQLQQTGEAMSFQIERGRQTA